MAIEKDVLKEMVGKRITIDGNRHRVEKVVVKTGLIITRDGTEALADGVYKKGPGFFYDSPTKGKKKTTSKPAAETPVKETARARRAREKLEAAEADAPKETARERRAREKLEAAEAEQPTSRRARNKTKPKDEEPAKPAGRKTRIKRDGDEAVPSKKKKMFEQFDQAIAERISQEAFDLLGQAYADKGSFGITAVAVGGKFDDDALRVTITFMPAAKDTKAIKSYIRDHREATDISSDEEEDDDLEDEELDDSDSEDEDLEDEEEIEDDEEEDDEEDDEDEDEEDEEEEAVTVEEMVDAIRGFAPDLKQKVLTKYVEGFYASDECTEKFDGELIPGFTRLQEKGGKGPECLLIGFDEEDEVVKLLNLSTLKTRSKSITEVVHMEVLELEDEEDDE